MKIGTSLSVWEHFRKANPEEWPRERILREVKEAGFEGVMTWPKEGQTPQQFLDYLADFGLRPVPGYFTDEFWHPEKRETQVEDARQFALTSRELGLSEMFVAPAGWCYLSRASGKERNQIAGRVGIEDGLSDEEWNEMFITLNAIGKAALEEGVEICIHNHAAMVLETRRECDRLLSGVDPSLVFWGPDSGHMAFAGDDAAAFFCDYAPHIKSMHLKDIVPAVLQQGVANEWDYGTTASHGVWAELGQGNINFPSIFSALREVNYDGWVVSEIDSSQKPSPLQSARECREYLATQGL